MELYTVIIEDETLYPASKDGSIITNLYEKITVKLRRDVTIPAKAIVAIVGGVGVVYGEYRNQLSVTAEDVKVVQASMPNGQKEG